MTNDRELLEAAAKAAGIKLADEIDSHIPSGGLWIVSKSGRDAVWDPLRDDGDALRLAVKLRLRIDIDDEAGTVFVSRPWNADAEAEEALFGDSYAMVRRAIVRAAAALPWTTPTP